MEPTLLDTVVALAKNRDNQATQYEDKVQVALRAIAHKLAHRSPPLSATSEWPAKTYIELSEFLVEEQRALLSSTECGLTLPSTSTGLVSLEQAEQIGRLVFEIVMNAVKHAHPTGIRVQVNLACSRSPDGRLAISISDDGVGLPEALDPYREGGTGLQKIRVLAKTLNAELRIDSNALGTTFVITLPANSTTIHGNTYFRKILDELPAAVYTVDSSGYITYFNEAAATLWGRSPEIGSSKWSGALRLYWPDGRAMPHDQSPMALAVREKRQVRDLEAIIERPDGTRVRYRPHPTPLFDDEGALIGAASMLLDMTDRDRARELQQVLASIVESSDDAILSKDLDGIITSWNAGCERLYGYTSEEAVGRPVTILVPADRRYEVQEYLARLRRGEKIEHYETVRRRKDGSLIDISLTVSPIRNKDGIIVGASKVARDITERRRAAEQQAMLLGEMRHRAKNLATVIEALARQSRPRDEPAVAAFIDAFMGRLRALLSTGELMLGSPTRDVELNQMLEKVLQPFVDPNQVDRFTLKGPPWIIAERTAGSLALAIHELATNALKYGALTASSGRVLISWTVEHGDAEQRVRIVWRESGGPPTVKPEHEGFGSRVIASALSRERNGKVEVLFEPEGLRCTFEFTPNGEAD